MQLFKRCLGGLGEELGDAGFVAGGFVEVDDVALVGAVDGGLEFDVEFFGFVFVALGCQGADFLFEGFELGDGFLVA